MDFRTIATNLATAIGTITVGTDTATATARLPNTIGRLGLLVYPPTTNLSFLMGGPSLNAHLLFPVRLLRDPLDVPSRTDALLDWATALWPKPQANYDLNVAGVIEAQAKTIRIEIDGELYALQPFDVVEMMVDVHVYELATFSP
jgi:hypothetical protein